MVFRCKLNNANIAFSSTVQGLDIITSWRVFSWSLLRQLINHNMWKTPRIRYWSVVFSRN